MRLYLAGVEGAGTYDKCFNYIKANINNIYILSSFYYARNKKKMQELIKLIPKENLLLDSGAFTFITHGTQNINIDKYVDDYINFINTYNIKYFFEMDIDACYPYSKVLELRQRIEKETGKKSIPVFHKTRGYKELLNIIEHYNYIAIPTREYKNDKQNIRKITSYCNKQNVKIHGLAHTNGDFWDDGFYSVDSTSWNAGAFGGMWTWNQERQRAIKTNRKLNKRVKSELQKDLYLHNLKVWLHFQKILKYKGYWRS